jgi:hypothetical protein
MPPSPPKNSLYSGNTYASIAHPHQLIGGKFTYLPPWFTFSTPSFIISAVSVIRLKNLLNYGPKVEDDETPFFFLYFFFFFQNAPFELCFTKKKTATFNWKAVSWAHRLEYFCWLCFTIFGLKNCTYFNSTDKGSDKALHMTS